MLHGIDYFKPWFPNLYFLPHLSHAHAEYLSTRPLADCQSRRLTEDDSPAATIPPLVAVSSALVLSLAAQPLSLTAPPFAVPL
ncbi:unnamed protein product [Citrullus colocynthis]|uniref:Uncharacterized protein n=1 Tax=Citrullus colocynthis TaxID=252529 RepID=A0ABP0Z1J7_9ROSI